MKVTIEYGDEERDEAMDAIGIYSWRCFVDAFEEKLRRQWKWGEWKHDETHQAIEDLWEDWHELKADLPKSGE